MFDSTNDPQAPNPPRAERIQLTDGFSAPREYYEQSVTWIDLRLPGLPPGSEIPIVFSVGGDPVKGGLIASMSRPGGNLTGFAFGLYEEKQLQVLKAAVPAISRVAYTVFPENTAPSLEIAATLGLQMQYIAVQSWDDSAPFFVAAKQAGADAALIPDVARLGPHGFHRGNLLLRRSVNITLNAARLKYCVAHNRCDLFTPSVRQKSQVAKRLFSGVVTG